MGSQRDRAHGTDRTRELQPSRALVWPSEASKGRLRSCVLVGSGIRAWRAPPDIDDKTARVEGGLPIF